MECLYTGWWCLLWFCFPDTEFVGPPGVDWGCVLLLGCWRKTPWPPNEWHVFCFILFMIFYLMFIFILLSILLSTIITETIYTRINKEIWNCICVHIQDIIHIYTIHLLILLAVVLRCGSAHWLKWVRIEHRFRLELWRETDLNNSKLSGELTNKGSVT